jgi:hypothetical protein
MPPTRLQAAAGRAAESALRVIRTLLIAMNRDYERCGKAACARSRRCRGDACDRALASGASQRRYGRSSER